MKSEKKKSKLLVITPYFYPKVGGLENYAYNICKGLRKKFGWKVVVVTSNHYRQANQLETIDGIKIYRIPRMFKISNTPINPLWYFKIRNIIEIEKPDIINSHTPVPIISDIAARVSRDIPFVLTYHNDLSKQNVILNFLCRLYYIILGFQTLRISNKIIATSKYYVDNSHYLQSYHEKIDIVHPGVDTKRFNKHVKNNYLKKKYGDYNFVVFVGQMDKSHVHKGVDFLIKSLGVVRKKVKNIKLILVGTGDRVEYYRTLANKKGMTNDVLFAGFVSDEKLPYYYSGSSVTVLPTTDDSEGFGMVLIESMACGTPVIGSEVGGIPYVIQKNRSGILVPPENSSKIAQAIIKVIQNKKYATNLAKKAYERVNRKFNWDIQVQRTHSIFQELI